MKNDEMVPGRRVSEINVTPLVDVLLVLLIIFMVALPTLREGFDGKLPLSDPEGGPAHAVVLQVGPSGELAINKAAVAEEDLGDRLEAIFSTRRDKVLFVQVDDKAGYGHLIHVLDVCRSKGHAEGFAFIMGAPPSKG
jgi:biopolymer transport protein TolR